MDVIFENFMLGEVDVLDFWMLVGVERSSGGHGCDQLVEICALDLGRSLDF